MTSMFLLAFCLTLRVLAGYIDKAIWLFPETLSWIMRTLDILCICMAVIAVVMIAFEIVRQIRSRTRYRDEKSNVRRIQ